MLDTTSNSNKPCLFIDFNGVISMNNFWCTLQNPEHIYHTHGQNIERYLFVEDKSIISDWMIGKYTTEDIHRILEEKLQIPYHEILSIFIDETKSMDISQAILDRLELLKARYYTIMVTDNMDSFELYTKPSVPRFERVFDEIVNSYTRKASKSSNDGAIFQELANKYTSDMKQSILIDDSSRNCAIFTALGGKSHRARGEEETIMVLDTLL